MTDSHELLTHAEALKSLASTVQDEERSPEDRTKIHQQLNEQYHEWYRNGLAYLDAKSESDAKQKFEREYEGSFFSNKILSFLTNGLDISPLYDAEKPTPIFSKWMYQVNETFHKPIVKQCNYIAAASSSKATPEATLANGWNPTICRILDAFIDKADNATTNNEKKFAYEYIALFLIGAIDGLRVLGQDERGTAEEIDVWVANQSKNVFFQKHIGDPFIVECKNWQSPVNAKELRSLRAVMDDKNVRFALVLARSGVTGKEGRDATAIIHRAFRESKIIVVVDHDDLLRCAGGVDPATLIEEKVYELFKSS